MVTNPVLQWAFTATFLAVAAHCVWTLAIGSRGTGHHRRGPAMLDQFCHLLMSLDMAAMAWPWWSAFPAAPQVVVFTLAAAWFATSALTALRSALDAAHRPSGTPAAALVHHGVHAVMMLAMVWMVATMPSGPAMAGGMAAGMGMGGHHHAPLAPTATAAGIAFTVAMLAAAVGYLTLLEPAGRTGRRKAERATGAAMSAGMAAMCWLMISA